jgi:uncharacterized membrane protein
LNRTFLLRLVFDFVAAGLLLVGLAYYWLDNTVHEIVGTGMFLLIIVHNLLNRRWYKTLAKSRHEARGLINSSTILLLAAAMLALLVTSLMISRTVFSFLPFSGGFSTRQIHILVAWWALIIVSLHLGMRWSMLMNVARNLAGIKRTNTLRTITLRVITVLIALQGIRSWFEIGMGAKLTAKVSMEFWDFNESTAEFFIHLIAIAGLFISISHYLMKLLCHFRGA